jgi:hypothetical protein
MRAIALVFLGLGVLASSVALAASGSAGPRLELLAKDPLVLRGSGFARRELVVVRVGTRRTQLVQRTRASRLGRFVARFDVAVDACDGAQRATAVGRTGRRASIVLERPWRRACVDLGNAP